MEDEKYQTLLENHSSRRQEVYELDGSLIIALPPGMSKAVTSCSRQTVLARFEKLEWNDEGQVLLTWREGFTKGADPYAVEWVNAEGGPVERVTLQDGTTIHLTKGLPVQVLLGPEDELAKFKTVELRVVDKAFKSPQFRGFLYRDKVLSRIPSNPRG